MRRFLLLAGTYGALIGGVGCDSPPETPPDARVAFDTVDGVVHVVSGDRGAWVRGGSWNVDRQGMVVGGADASRAVGSVTGVAVGAHDRIYVANDRGRYYERVMLPAAGSGEEMAILIHDPWGSAADTVRLGWIEPDPGRAPRPFEPRPSLAVGPEGHIYFARGDAYRITVLSSGGDTLRVLRRRVLPRPVSVAERDSALALMGTDPRWTGVSPPDTMEIPGTKPVIDGLVVDDLGHLWVRMWGDPAWSHLEWAVHEPGGRYLGAVATPRMDVRQVGDDFLAGVVRDEAGERVVVYRLLK